MSAPHEFPAAERYIDECTNRGPDSDSVRRFGISRRPVRVGTLADKKIASVTSCIPRGKRPTRFGNLDGPDDGEVSVQPSQMFHPSIGNADMITDQYECTGQVSTTRLVHNVVEKLCDGMPTTG
jgi:hypothetical protein